MDNQIKKYLTVLALTAALPSSLIAAPLWSDVVNKSATATAQAKLHSQSRHVSLDFVQMKAALAQAAAVSVGGARKTQSSTQINLPMPYGGLQTFNVSESSVMAPELAAKYPQIKTYKIVAVNEPTVTGVLDTGSKGFHAYLNTAEGEMFINPASLDQQEYYSFYKQDYASTTSKAFSCGVQSKSASESPISELKAQGVSALARTSDSIITYRLAVAATAEYSLAVKQASSSTIAAITADALAEITTAITRINQIYERDLAVRFELVGNNDLVIYTDSGTDPYSNSNPSALLSENQATLDTRLGSANYDIGHVFSTGGGGLAGLGVACDNANKARGETGLPNPDVGDLFYIDFVAHELGHQLGANHTFNGTTNSCAGGNRNASTAYEPGGGSTVMAYAGICGTENIASASDATFHAGSVEEILIYTRAGGACYGAIASSIAPMASVAAASYTIPGGTAFTLVGSASDADTPLVNLIYQWDQMDAGTATSSATHGTDNGSNALFRSYLPVATAERTFPALATLLGTNSDALAAKAETLPIEDRTLDFRFTVRDQTGGVDEDDMQVVVDGVNSGPFEILQPNGGESLSSLASQVIEWNVACTDVAPVSCAAVDIFFSSDGGLSFSPLIGATPNDGNELLTLPSGNTSTARIKVACSDNVFFDISNTDFSINDATGTSLPATGTPESCGTAVGVAPDDGNNTLAEAQVISVPNSLSSTVNELSDIDDLYRFVANASSYTITLSGYGSNDLDLYLLNSSGGIIDYSYSEFNPTEVITKVLSAGQTYYIVVNAFDTAGIDSAYTLTVTEGSIPSGGGGGAFSAYYLFMLLMAPLLRLQPRRIH